MNVDPWEQPGEGLPEAEPQAFKEVSEDEEELMQPKPRRKKAMTVGTNGEFHPNRVSVVT
jgi:hypothetical protein